MSPAATNTVLGVIPARLASTRFPEKMLAPIAGKPLLQWTIERARKAASLDQLVVATDSKHILELCESINVRAVMTREDHPSGTDRVAEAAQHCGEDNGTFEIVINIQGDEPLIDPALIDNLAQRLLDDPTADMITAATPIQNLDELRSPSVVKVVTAADGAALYFSRATIPCFRDETDEQALAARLHRRHLGIYGYRTTFLHELVKAPPTDLENAERLEQLRALHLGARLLVVDTDAVGPGVDRPEDISIAEDALRQEGLL